MSSVPNGTHKTILAVAAAGWLAGCAGPAQSPPVVVAPTVPLPTTRTVAATSPSTAPAPADPVIATAGQTAVKRSELVEPLLKAYGLNVLMLIVQRDMAREACREQAIAVTPADVKYEHDWTLGRMFETADAKDDREKLLDQFLAQPKPRDQTTTRDEFDIIIETNAFLRKLVEPTIKKSVTDEMLRQEFDEEYATQIVVRDILVTDPRLAAQVRAKALAGADFAKLATQYSRSPETARMGGELPPFSRNSTRFPEEFKRIAFALKPGEVSDPLGLQGGFHILKLERSIQPKAVKFEDVKDDLRQGYETRLLLQGVAGVRERLAYQALQQLQVTDPLLKAEFDKRMQARNQLIQDRTKIREEMDKQRASTTNPATAPAATAPSTATAPVVVKPTTTPAPAAVPASKPLPATSAPVPALPAKPPVVSPPAVVVPPPPISPSTRPAASAPSTRP